MLLIKGGSVQKEKHFSQVQDLLEEISVDKGGRNIFGVLPLHAGVSVSHKYVFCFSFPVIQNVHYMMIMVGCWRVNSSVM